MVEKQVEVKLKTGLQARPASFVCSERQIAFHQMYF